MGIYTDMQIWRYFLFYTYFWSYCIQKNPWIKYLKYTINFININHIFQPQLTSVRCICYTNMNSYTRKKFFILKNKLKNDYQQAKSPIWLFWLILNTINSKLRFKFLSKFKFPGCVGALDFLFVSLQHQVT